MFKPSDEEPFSANNPKLHRAPTGSTAEGLRRGVQPGEGAVREVRLGPSPSVMGCCAVHGGLQSMGDQPPLRVSAFPDAFSAKALLIVSRVPLKPGRFPCEHCTAPSGCGCRRAGGSVPAGSRRLCGRAADRAGALRGQQRGRGRCFGRRACAPSCAQGRQPAGVCPRRRRR